MSRIKFPNFLPARRGATDHLRNLTIVILTLASLGVVFAVVTALFEGLLDGAFGLRLCFERSCLSRAMFLYKAPIVVLSGTLALLSAVATVGGIFVALQSYVASTKAVAFSNHISQLNAFLAYVSSEIAKRPRVAAQSVDAFYWYRVIFEHAGTGDLAVSSRYVVTMGGLNEAIDKSNDLATKATKDRFKYVEHQDRMISSLHAFGISLVRQPRLEFFEIEEQVISMIRAVNFAFCGKDDVPVVRVPSYL